MLSMTALTSGFVTTLHIGALALISRAGTTHSLILTFGCKVTHISLTNQGARATCDLATDLGLATLLTH